MKHLQLCWKHCWNVLLLCFCWTLVEEGIPLSGLRGNLLSWLLIIGHDWESVTWLGAGGGIRHQLEGVAVDGNAGRSQTAWQPGTQQVDIYIYPHGAQLYIAMGENMIRGTRMTRTLIYISVKNKGFLAGDRLKKKGFFIVHLKNSEDGTGSPGIMKAQATTL